MQDSTLQCSACGACTEAACDCGVAYISAGKRAAAAVAAAPEKSDRAIAAEIGVDHKTVGSARRSGGDDSPTEEARRVGQDGKSYPAKIIKIEKQEAIEKAAEFFVASNVPGHAATNKLIKHLAGFSESFKLSFAAWLENDPHLEAALGLVDALDEFAFYHLLRRQAEQLISTKRKADKKVHRDYCKRFGGCSGTHDYERVLLMVESLRSGTDQLTDVKRQNEEARERFDREQEEFQRTPITAETEIRYTTLIRERELYEGACMLAWSMYFEYRDQHPDLTPLSEDDLAYAGLWTSCAVRLTDDQSISLTGEPAKESTPECNSYDDAIDCPSHITSPIDRTPFAVAP
jgi:hypothetical protein